MKPWNETWQVDANPSAALIAAAPELYRALERLGNAVVMGSREDIIAASQYAAGALAKARGEI